MYELFVICHECQACAGSCSVQINKKKFLSGCCFVFFCAPQCSPTHSIVWCSCNLFIMHSIEAVHMFPRTRPRLHHGGISWRTAPRGKEVGPFFGDSFRPSKILFDLMRTAGTGWTRRLRFVRIRVGRESSNIRPFLPGRCFRPVRNCSSAKNKLHIVLRVLCSQMQTTGTMNLPPVHVLGTCGSKRPNVRRGQRQPFHSGVMTLRPGGRTVPRPAMVHHNY